jgi:hypothetical protein
VVLAALCSCAADPSDADDDIPTCGDAARYEEYVPGLETTGDAGTSFVLEHANPGPPEKGDNVWAMLVYDAAGDPVQDSSLSVSAWMPDHGHGSPVDPVVTPGSFADEFEVSSLVINMGGFWEITVRSLDGDGAEIDHAVFGICIQD